MIDLVSVNVGQARPIAAKSGQTGIFKTPQDGPVMIAPEGVEGDTIVDRKHHGGPAQAVYAYSVPDLHWWMEELGAEVPPGAFGENLTLDGIASGDFALGDRLIIGDVVLRVTSPRIPCATLEARFGLPGFAARFRMARRPGPYFRVDAPGQIRAGQTVAFQPFDGLRMPIARFTEPHWPERLNDEEKAVLPETGAHPGILAEI